MGPAGPGIVLLQGQRPANRRVSWGACLYSDPDAIAFLRSIGAQKIYLWAYPAYWSGPAAVHSMGVIARAHNVAGFIADLEDTYDSHTLGLIKAAIVDEIGHGLDVGITTFPSWGGLDSFHDVATWCLVQIYGKTSLNIADFEHWYQRCAAILPTYRLIATFVPATATGHTLSTVDGYSHYLSIALKGQTWGSWGAGPAYMQAALARHSAMPWDTLVAATIGGTIFGIQDGGYFAWAAIVVALIAVAVAAIFAWWRQR